MRLSRVVLTFTAAFLLVLSTAAQPLTAVADPTALQASDQHPTAQQAIAALTPNSTQSMISPIMGLIMTNLEGDDEALSPGMAAQAFIGHLDCSVTPIFAIESKNWPNKKFVWTFWAGDTIPQPLDFFIGTWRRQIHTDERNFIVISNPNIHKYLTPCDLPNRWIDHKGDAARSDAVRAAVLAKYGGIWMDATTIVVGDTIDRAWDRLHAGSSEAVFCGRDNADHKAPWTNVEAYFLMTKERNPIFSLWADKIREVGHDRTSMDGICNDPFYRNVDLKDSHLGGCQDYFGYANIMWMTMAMKDSFIRREIETSWIKFDAFSDCMRMYAGLDWSRYSFVNTFDRNKYRNLISGVVHIHKMTKAREIVELFQKRYGSNPIELASIQEPTYMTCALRRGLGLDESMC